MMKSALLHKVSVNESAAMGISKKHQMPLCKRQDMISSGTPFMLGGGGNISVSSVLVEDEVGVFPGIQVVSQEGGMMVLDYFAVEDVVSAFTRLKPHLEGALSDLKIQGLVI